jgi:hypothetical protein
MLPNRQLLISFIIISDKSIKGKEKFERFELFGHISWTIRHTTISQGKFEETIFYSQINSNSQVLIQQNSSAVSSFY